MSSAWKTLSKVPVYLVSRSQSAVTVTTPHGCRDRREVSGLLGDPLSGGMSGDTSDVQAAGGVFEEHQRVEPL
jgi:hypothetical protein